MLTKKQRDLLLFIHAKLQDGGVAPSFDEMKEALNLKSKSGIHRLIGALVERGFLRRLPHRARALEIIKLPDSDGLPSASNNPFQSTRPAVEADPDTVEIPLHGRIAAGTPIEALEQYENIGVPANMLGGGGGATMRLM